MMYDDEDVEAIDPKELFTEGEVDYMEQKDSEE